jgi:hypothetical protein
MDKVHKPITTQYYVPSSKPFRIYLFHYISTDIKLISDDIEINLHALQRRKTAPACTSTPHIVNLSTGNEWLVSRPCRINCCKKGVLTNTEADMWVTESLLTQSRIDKFLRL